jgi:hypothetical protein
MRIPIKEHTKRSWANIVNPVTHGQFQGFNQLSQQAAFCPVLASKKARN